MESDAYLEFKWKGDQFLIFLFFFRCGVCIDSLSYSPAAVVPFKRTTVADRWAWSGKRKQKIHPSCSPEKKRKRRLGEESAFILENKWKDDLKKITLKELILILILHFYVFFPFVESHRRLLQKRLQPPHLFKNQYHHWQSQMLITSELLCWELTGGLRIKKTAWSWSRPQDCVCNFPC